MSLFRSRVAWGKPYWRIAATPGECLTKGVFDRLTGDAVCSTLLCQLPHRFCLTL